MNEKEAVIFTLIEPYLGLNDRVALSFLNSKKLRRLSLEAQASVLRSSNLILMNCFKTYKNKCIKYWLTSLCKLFEDAPRFIEGLPFTKKRNSKTVNWMIDGYCYGKFMKESFWKLSHILGKNPNLFSALTWACVSQKITTNIKLSIKGDLIHVYDSREGKPNSFKLNRLHVENNLESFSRFINAKVGQKISFFNKNGVVLSYDNEKPVLNSSGLNEIYQKIKHCNLALGQFSVYLNVILNHQRTDNQDLLIFAMRFDREWKGKIKKRNVRPGIASYLLNEYLKDHSLFKTYIEKKEDVKYEPVNNIAFKLPNMEALAILNELPVPFDHEADQKDYMEEPTLSALTRKGNLIFKGPNRLSKEYKKFFNNGKPDIQTIHDNYQVHRHALFNKMVDIAMGGNTDKEGLTFEPLSISKKKRFVRYPEKDEENKNFQAMLSHREARIEELKGLKEIKKTKTVVKHHFNDYVEQLENEMKRKQKTIVERFQNIKKDLNLDDSVLSDFQLTKSKEYLDKIREKKRELNVKGMKSKYYKILKSEISGIKKEFAKYREDEIKKQTSDKITKIIGKNDNEEFVKVTVDILCEHKGMSEKEKIRFEKNKKKKLDPKNNPKYKLNLEKASIKLVRRLIKIKSKYENFLKRKKTNLNSKMKLNDINEEKIEVKILKQPKEFVPFDAKRDCRKEKNHILRGYKTKKTFDLVELFKQVLDSCICISANDNFDI